MGLFQGFGPQTVRFLEDLEDHNDRDWFKANKHRYDSDVLEPALDFITAMGPRIEKISECFTAIPKRMGGSLMRVYRDTRFSKDKTPYKTNIGIQFRHERGKDVHAPGYYLHIETTGCFLGAGIWHPESGVLRAIRERISSKPDEWQRVLSAKSFNDTYTLGGDSLKRPPRGFGEDTPHLDDVKRKDFIGVCDFSIGEAASAKFADQVAKRFVKASPLMRFLCAAAEVEF
ncbi:MAG: DUF2461 domain-containing protein [Pseudomonadales bacterium]